MQKVIFWFTFILSLCLTACNWQSQQTAALTASTAADCPVTQSPDPRFIPPTPYSEYPDEGMFWVGSAELWTAVPSSTTWEALPHDANGYSQKLFWWSQDYANEVIPALTVTGQQLDGEAATLKVESVTNGLHDTPHGFMLAGVTLPMAGCWQITGSYNGQDLSYVVWVTP